MTIRGMDVEEAERLVGQLEAQANAINNVVSIVDNAVNVLGSLWFGADLQHFQGTWRGNQRAQANSAAVDISHALTILRREIDAQRRASGGGHASTRSHGGGYSGLGGGNRGGGGVDLLGGIRDAFGNPVVGLINNTKDLIEGGLTYRLHSLGVGISADEISKIITPSKTLRGIGNFLGVVGFSFDALTFVEGVHEKDTYKMISGGSGMALFGVAMVVPGGAAVAAAGGIALTVGSAVLPTNAAEFDGAYTLAVKNIYGISPDQLTPAQADQMAKRYEGPLGFLTSMSDGMDYKYEKFLQDVGVADAYHQAQRDFHNTVSDVTAGVGKAVGDAGRSVTQVANDIGRNVSQVAENVGSKVSDATKAVGGFVGGVGNFFGIK